LSSKYITKKNDFEIVCILEDEERTKIHEYNQEEKNSICKYPRGIRPRSLDFGFSIVTQSESSPSETIFTIYKKKLLFCLIELHDSLILL
jgi:hypothetical protein